MQPLFKHDLALTLHFASALFLGIYNAKVTRIDDPSERRSWEMAQSSVLSGILDYLDEHKTAKAKGPIGQAFFTTLCRLYFSSAIDQPVKADPDLLATVYMLLSDIVSGQAGNAAAFRKELMGGDVENVDLSSSGQKITVTLKLNSPPSIGKNLVKCGTQNIEAHWNLEKSEVDRFVRSLRHRKVVTNTKNLEYTRKLSIAEAVSLQQSSSPPKPTQDKVEVIQNLWGDTESNRAGTDCLPTSPFLARILPPNSEEGRAMVSAEEPSKTVFIDGEGNLTDKPTRVEQKPASPAVTEKASNVKPDPILMTKALSVLTRTLSAGKGPGQEQVPQRNKPGILSKRKSQVVISEEESEVTDPDDEFNPPSPSPMSTFSLRPAPSGGKPEMKVAATKCGPGNKKASAPAVASLTKPTPKQEKPKLLESRDVPGAKASAPPVKRDPSAPPRSVAAKKRSAPEPMDDDDEPPAPPAKKARPSPKSKPPPSTRYSKRKLRNSSPITVDVSDDDEPPKAPSTTLKRPLLDSRKKKAAMKDRNGQANTKQPAPRPRRKTATNQNKENTPHRKDLKPDTMSLRKGSGVKPPLKKDLLSVKKEAVTPHVKPKEAPKSTDTKRSDKPKQAPWQRDSFMTNIQNQSTPVKQPEVEVEPEQNSMDWEPTPAGAFDFETVKPGEQELIVVSDDSNASKTFVTEPVAEYWMPTKGANESFDEPVIVKMEQRDIVMVDLTSPVKPLVALEPKKPHTVAGRQADVKVEAGMRGNAPETRVEPEHNHKKRRESFSRVEMPKHDTGESKSARGKDEKIEHSDKTSADATHSSGAKQPEARIQPRHQDEEPEQPPKAEVPVKSSDVGGGSKTLATVSKKVGKIPSYPRLPSERPPERPKATNKKQDDGRGEYTLRLPRLRATDRGIHGRLRSDSPKGLIERDVQPSNYQRPSYATKNPLQQRNSNDPAQDILEVLRQINEGILDKINRRCEDTSQGMSLALLEILEGAAEDLKPFAEHFNALVDIEEEYATHRRKIMTAIDSFRKSADQAGQAIKQITQSHGRHGLSKRFSPTLFTKPVPTVTLDF
ncbi:hypothetical protein H1R20_g3110, partial [Candolleomyces eurysporus]